jgi:hypothetical protein
MHKIGIGIRGGRYMRHSTSLLGLAVENLPPPLLPLSLSMSYLIRKVRAAQQAAQHGRARYWPGPGSLAAL